MEALLDPFEEPAEGAGATEQPTPLPPEPLPVPLPVPVPTPRPVAPAAAGKVPAYRAWAASDVPDPRYARQGDLVAILLDVVAAEGPVLARRAYRLILQAAGFQRLVHTVVSPLNKAAVRAEREGRLVAVPSGIGSSLVDRVLRLPDQPQVVVRKARCPRSRGDPAVRGPGGCPPAPWLDGKAVGSRAAAGDPHVLRPHLAHGRGEHLHREVPAGYGRAGSRTGPAAADLGEAHGTRRRDDATGATDRASDEACPGTGATGRAGVQEGPCRHDCPGPSALRRRQTSPCD